jgi:hypothetical protein
MSKTLTWDQIVAAVEAHGNSGSAQDAISNDTEMPEDEVGVVQIGDDEFTIRIGTDCGEIELTEDYVVYEDDVELVYDDDDHRETIAMDVLPEYITQHLN